MSGRRLYSVTWAGSSARESDGLLTRRSGVQIPPGPLSRGTDVTSGAAPDLNQGTTERERGSDRGSNPSRPALARNRRDERSGPRFEPDGGRAKRGRRRGANPSRPVQGTAEYRSDLHDSGRAAPTAPSRRADAYLRRHGRRHVANSRRPGTLEGYRPSRRRTTRTASDGVCHRRVPRRHPVSGRDRPAKPGADSRPPLLAGRDRIGLSTIVGS
jgi:hypothetical protein